MFPRCVLLLLFFCTLYYQCYGQATSTTTIAPLIRDTTLSDAEIIFTAMACVIFSVLIVLGPTLFYYKYCSKEIETKSQSTTS